MVAPLYGTPGIHAKGWGRLSPLAPEAKPFWRAEHDQVHLETATAGPRTVPVRSSMAGVKSPECSGTPRPSDVLRAGTARAPVVVSRCASTALPGSAAAPNLSHFCWRNRIVVPSGRQCGMDRPADLSGQTVRMCETPTQKAFTRPQVVQDPRLDRFRSRADGPFSFSPGAG